MTDTAQVTNDDLVSRLQTQSNPNIPVRTLVKIEVGDLSKAEIHKALASVAAKYTGNHTTYIIPVRDGKLTTDVLFEQEILDFVNSICEVKDNSITLKGGPITPVDKATFTV